MKVLRLVPLIVIAAGLGVAVVHADLDRSTAWSPVVYPDQRLPLTFWAT